MIRACTGFDGGSEVEEAIRGAGPRIKSVFKYKRRRKFSVRCLVAAVGLKSLHCLSHRLQRGEALRFQSFEGMEEFMKLLK